MNEYIEREEAIAAIKNIQGPILSREVGALRKLPAADVVEVRHGRWLRYWCDNNLIGHEYAACSVCGCHMLDTNPFWNSSWCPNCGARMDGE